MTIYPDEQKARLIEQMLPPDPANVPRLAKETGIPRDTLYGWRRQALRARGLSPMLATSGGERWRSVEKFAMGVETATLSEMEPGEYCRKRGLYLEQLQTWRRACEQANGGLSPRMSGERSAEQRRIRALERERRCKEKALAEPAALLVWRKKAPAIWGEGEAE